MNDTIFFYLYSFAHQSFYLDWLIVFCSDNFGYIMVCLAVIFLVFHTDGVFDYRTPFLQFKNKFKEVSFVLVTSVSAWVIEGVLKLLIVSPRPFLVFENVKPLFLHGGMDSFPSGHAMFFSALAVSLYFIHKRIGVLFFVVALIVGLARIAAGIHFPIDILFGYIFGIIVALIFRLIFRKILGKSKLK